MHSLFCSIDESIGFLAPQNIRLDTKIIIIGEKLEKLLQVLGIGHHLEFYPFSKVKKFVIVHFWIPHEKLF